METIHHIKTGGTIGGCVPEYKEIGILSDVFSEAFDLGKYLNQSLKISSRYTEKEVCHKDSREITEEDRSQITKNITSQYQNGVNKFLITHGTYTMPETGVYLLENLSEEILDKIQVVITGSMFPWSVLGSDAPMNLGASVGSLLNTKVTGVKICMHAKLFDPTKVKKNEEGLIFEST